jgi:uncharacterized protein
MSAQVQLSTGITTEVVLIPPPGKLNENKLAVCLHPWSFLGGRMNDPVLLSLTEVISAKSYYVLRYNSRGVGYATIQECSKLISNSRSTGWPSLSGLSEGQDLRALVQWAMQQIPNVQSVLLVVCCLNLHMASI